MQSAEETEIGSEPQVTAPIPPVQAAPGAPHKLTPAMVKALGRAAARERGNYCPVPSVHANAETMLLNALDRRGFIVWDNPEPRFGNSGSGAPRITDAGRAAIAQAKASGIKGKD